MEFYPTKDIKLAACLDKLGVPRRNCDPVTKEMQERNGRPFDQCTYWFDISEEDVRTLCSGLIQAYKAAEPMFKWKSAVRQGKPYNLAPGNFYLFDQEHPLYYCMDSLFNRETWLHWSRNDAEPLKVFQEGDKTVVMSTRASQETKDKIKKYL